MLYIYSLSYEANWIQGQVCVRVGRQNLSSALGLRNYGSIADPPTTLKKICTRTTTFLALGTSMTDKFVPLSL